MPRLRTSRIALVAVALVGAIGCAVLAQQPAPSAPRDSKADLTPQSWGQLHALIRPHANEWRHLKVEWLTDVTAARKRAAAEDKPIVICYTGGAGYNEPLGVC